jgi:hypothetical protein
MLNRNKLLLLFVRYCFEMIEQLFLGPWIYHKNFPYKNNISLQCIASNKLWLILLFVVKSHETQTLTIWCGIYCMNYGQHTHVHFVEMVQSWNTCKQIAHNSNIIHLNIWQNFIWDSLNIRMCDIAWCSFTCKTLSFLSQSIYVI